MRYIVGSSSEQVEEVLRFELVGVLSEGFEIRDTVVRASGGEDLRIAKTR
jgi:hypothetical protein